MTIKCVYILSSYRDTPTHPQIFAGAPSVKYLHGESNKNEFTIIKIQTRLIDAVCWVKIGTQTGLEYGENSLQVHIAICTMMLSRHNFVTKSSRVL